MSTQATTPVTVDLLDNGVLTVTLSRPEVRNALDHRSFLTLGEAFGQRAHQPDVRAVVLRATGEHFCSGLDRNLLAAMAEGGDNISSDIGEQWQQALLAVEDCPRPTIAVIQGVCIGGGVELALACDFRIASDDASFALLEMRYAFLPDLGGIHRLQRDVGLTRTKQMLYFGDPVDAPTLERWGALTQVVPRSNLDDTAKQWTARCAAAAPLAVAAAKRLIQRDPTGTERTSSLREAIQENVTHLLRTADFREGLTSAMERRPPQFRGQ